MKKFFVILLFFGISNFAFANTINFLNTSQRKLPIELQVHYKTSIENYEGTACGEMIYDSEDKAWIDFPRSFKYSAHDMLRADVIRPIYYPTQMAPQCQDQFEFASLEIKNIRNAFGEDSVSFHIKAATEGQPSLQRLVCRAKAGLSYKCYNTYVEGPDDRRTWPPESRGDWTLEDNNYIYLGPTGANLSIHIEGE